MDEESWKVYSTTLRKLLRRPQLLSQFREDMDGTKTADLNISNDMRTDLKDFFLNFHSSRTEESSVKPFQAIDDKVADSVKTADDFFTTSYTHLRRSALATTIMSILIFMMGLFLLGVAAAQSIRGNQPGTAIALAASGVVAIAAAFYRSPVAQIRESAAEVQRASMVLMSYMLGMGLLNKSLHGEQTAAEAQMLTALTRDLIDLLPGDKRVGKSARREGQSGTISAGP